MKTVRDIMTAPVVTIDEESNILAVAKLMVEKKIGSVAVTKNGKLSGIITERDIAHKVVAANKDATKTKVAEVMHAQITTTGVFTSVNAASNILAQGGFRRLPVVDNNMLVGIVTETDIEIALREEALEESQARMRDHYKFAEQLRKQETKIEELKNIILELQNKLKE
ncbi:MAG: CBS domain-containing protein [Candidatus Altiarchaeota archaeon]|nr:CBS domain-containing protein [Candidatus Altiarchaeota archaeon]